MAATLLTNRIKGSKHFGKRYRVVGNTHVYADGTKVVMGPGGKGAKKPKAPKVAGPKKPVNAAAKNDANPLYNPLTQLSGDALVKAAKQITNLQVNPALAAQGRANRDAKVQGTALANRAGSYYKGLAKRDDKAAPKIAALGQMLDDRLKGIGTDVQNRMTANSTAQQAREVAGQDSRTPADAHDRVRNEEAALSSLAAAESGRARESGAKQSANYEGLQRTLAGARGLKGGEIQGQLLNRLANQMAEGRAKVSDLKSQRGNILAKNLLDMRGTSFENVLAGKSLDLKAADIATGLEIAKGAQATSAANNAASTAASRQNTQDRIDAQKTENQLNREARSNDLATRIKAQKELQRRKAKADAKKDKGKKNEFKPQASDRKFYTDVRSDAAWIKDTHINGKHPHTRQEALAAIRKGNPGSDPLVLRAALDIAYDGHVKGATIRAMRDAGYTIPPEWIKTVKGINKPYHGPVRPSGGGV